MRLKMNQFIYVFNKQDADYMETKGFVLLKSDDLKQVYIFANQDNVLLFQSSLVDVEYVLSNTLTF